MKLIIATGNAGKMKEIKSIFNNSGYEVVSMKASLRMWMRTEPPLKRTP